MGAPTSAAACRASSAAITRITAAGAIDPGFGAAGVLQLPLRSVESLETHGGDLLVLGWRPDPRVAALYRYDATGKPDQGFGEGRGYVDLIRMTRSFELAVDRKDRIWVHAAMPSSTAGVLRRLLPDGRQDAGFHRGWSPPVTRLLLTRRGATIVGTKDIAPRAFVTRFGNDGRLDGQARIRPQLGGGMVPTPNTRDVGRFRGAFSTTREAIARHPDGRIIVAGGVELDETNQGLTPGLIAIHHGALDRRFGRSTGAPDVTLVSTKKRGARAVALRLRAGTRGLTRLRLTLGGRTISRRFFPFLAAGGSSRGHPHGHHAERAAADPGGGRTPARDAARDLQGHGRQCPPRPVHRPPVTR